MSYIIHMPPAASSHIGSRPRSPQTATSRRLMEVASDYWSLRNSREAELSFWVLIILTTYGELCLTEWIKILWSLLHTTSIPLSVRVRQILHMLYTKRLNFGSVSVSDLGWVFVVGTRKHNYVETSETKSESKLFSAHGANTHNGIIIAMIKWIGMGILGGFLLVPWYIVLLRSSTVRRSAWEKRQEEEHKRPKENDEEDADFSLSSFTS